MHGSHAGWHLSLQAIVGAGESSQRLMDGSFLKGTFEDLIDMLGMEILIEPTFVEVPVDLSKVETDHDDGGITATLKCTVGDAVITTSHLSIHTWPLRNRFVMDVFSCKEFDAEQAMAFLADRFCIVAEKHNFVVRDWPNA